MQCVILCAGKGTRMGDLTLTTPKPLIKVCDKPVLQHIVEALPEEIDEIVLIVGYLQEQIRDFCGQEYKGKRVVYREQTDFAAGTADALWQAKDVLSGKFMHLNGDDIHGPETLSAAIKNETAIIAARSNTPERFGVCALHNDGTLQSIVEKPADPPSSLVNTGGFVFTDALFKYYEHVDVSQPDCLVEIVSLYAKASAMSVVEQDLWLPVGYPEHIAAAESVLCPDAR